MLLCCAAGGALAQTAPGDAWKPPQDRDLRHTLAAIERGFSQGNLAQLGALLPRQDKILLRWEDPVSQDGLLTSTQVLLFLRDLFLRYQTVTFKMQSGSLLPSGRLYHCMGRWSLTSRQGRSHKMELHFSLKQDAGVWTIRELRQTR